MRGFIGNAIRVIDLTPLRGFLKKEAWRLAWRVASLAPQLGSLACGSFNLRKDRHAICALGEFFDSEQRNNFRLTVFNKKNAGKIAQT